MNMGGTKMYEQIRDMIKEKGIVPENEHFEIAEMIIKECINQIEEAIPATWCAASPAYRTAKIAAIACIQHKFGMGL
jgi:hypothetical protein